MIKSQKSRLFLSERITTMVFGSSYRIPPNKKPPRREVLFGGRCRTRLARRCLASGTRFVNSLCVAYASLLINKTSPLAVKTTFRGCFYPRAYDGLRFETSYITYHIKIPPARGGIFIMVVDRILKGEIG